jgi:hypothetical protein
MLERATDGSLGPRPFPGALKLLTRQPVDQNRRDMASGLNRSPKSSKKIVHLKLAAALLVCLRANTGGERPAFFQTAL